ncbi:carbonic anhydrase family protein [Pseudonocardia sp. KRD-184]|uniref:Carbonic anhydrase family protein n=1 Tax=Pseudonocardia oceani TaxID=2792013 RepID=A0ABS6U647_9PSEU|nr:carbonic anhydrase family protein [Pseudonocardia oceani]MBW0092690.1 carbonic anhydrase family protein [Pseudonocardia oceani]MBW0099508.1 carbonic anhydrase family protein [Pseudonocardia oceani]MBW0112096.1 carbonic anhydrase family protein [Pseudonocardia oceani]MBW0125528.1 carbonic anhydrase family protein [Pseudonocardia oceani]MBW0127685.1 carbonic anhydrase family protein [Pseudonocardia oceani]
MPTRRTFLVALPVATAALVLPPGALAHAGARRRGTPHPQQSPIALDTSTTKPAPELPELVVAYPDDVEVSVRYVSRDPDDPAGCTTRGHEETVEAEVPEGAAAVLLGGSRYELVQFHFHTPSEHTLDGRRFPVEQHFVHRGPNGETLVVGLFLTDDGAGGTPQDVVLARLPEECGEEVTVGGLDLASALPCDLSTLRYPGSLTTTPNTEGVSWLVLRAPVAVAPSTLRGFQELFPEGDSRDLQPLGDRVVRLREQ